MTITTPLPTPPQTSDPSTFSARADAWVAAMAVFQTELDAYAAGLSPLGRNMLINPAFQIDQLNAGASTATADDAYCFDGWYALTQTGTVAASQLTDPENGYTHALRLTQSQASAQRFGFAQIVKGKNCKFARGGSGTLVPRIRCSASTPIRYAILGWTGTEDAVTSDVVYSWTNATFTAGQFFNSTTLSVLSVGAVTPSAATWTSLTALTVALGSSFNNIIVMIWTENTQAQNVTLDADYVQFEAGAAANSFERRPYIQELQNCQHHYAKLTALAVNTAFGAGVCYNATNGQFYIKYPVAMHGTPTFNGSGIAINDGLALFPVTALGTFYAGSDSGLIQCTAGGGGMTARSGGVLAANNSITGYIELISRL